MNPTPTFVQHPAPLVEALARAGCVDLLEGYVPRKMVGINYVRLELVAQQHGYRFRHEHGNLYGRLMLEPTPSTPVTTLRLVTRSDVAAVHGSRRRA